MWGVSRQWWEPRLTGERRGRRTVKKKDHDILMGNAVGRLRWLVAFVWCVSISDRDLDHITSVPPFIGYAWAG